MDRFAYQSMASHVHLAMSGTSCVTVVLRLAAAQIYRETRNQL
jgi:hypothetical protein